MIYPLIYSFYKYLLDINRVPGALLGTGATQTWPFQPQSSQSDGVIGREAEPSWKTEMVPKPAPSKVFFDKVTLELSFKGRVVVSQAKPNQKGRPGRGDSQSHSTKVESSLAYAFFQITVEYLLPTRL